MNCVRCKWTSSALMTHIVVDVPPNEPIIEGLLCGLCVSYLRVFMNEPRSDKLRYDDLVTEWLEWLRYIPYRRVTKADVAKATALLEEMPDDELAPLADAGHPLAIRVRQARRGES